MNLRFPLFGTALLAFTTFLSPVRASDHADPMSTVNPFKLQDDPVANITDLHAFLVDADRSPVLDAARVGSADQLIVSLCVRRRLLPWQIAGIGKDVPKYSFRVHLDLDPEVRFFDPAKTRDGRAYDATLADLDQKVAEAMAASDAADRAIPAGMKVPLAAHDQAHALVRRLLTERGGLVSQHQEDASTQALYGGIIANPDHIAEEVVLDFHLKFESDAENSEVDLDLEKTRIEGIPGPINMVGPGRLKADGSGELVRPSAWKPGVVNIQCGIFDDPFIFPRFFRGNVVGIVASIPLKRLRRPDGSPAAGGPVFFWATTHTPDGRQSDHVGRSLRTQLPRFGYLNGLHPSRHVAKIMQVHGEPDLFENILATFISPLEAHRHYDNAPDVMVFDLRKPAKFPNGRWFEDDVARTLADAGETLLVELSYAESKQFPRATRNDKPFRKDFPYLAERWTGLQTTNHMQPGTMIGDYRVPDAPDSGAIALPDLALPVWHSIWLGLVIGIVATAGLVFLAVRTVPARISTVIVGILGLMMVQPVAAKKLGTMDPLSMPQPQRRMLMSIGGTGLIGALGLVALYGFGVRRGIRAAAAGKADTLGSQSETIDDRQYVGSTFQEVRDAVLDEPYHGTTWGQDGDKPLPVHMTTFWGLATGLFDIGKRFVFLDAAKRTLVSHADLRWGGPERKGVRRLLHPNGVCLAGTWRITEDTPYTGYFSKGSQGLVIGRYSTGLGVRRGEKRTLSMVGKLFPTLDPQDRRRTASFITQEDLGAAFSPGIHDALLRNAPDVTTSARGFDIGTLLLVAFTFGRADKQKTVRQLYEVAELGKPAGVRTRCPRYMQLKISSPKIGGGEATADFRDEVLAQIYDRGSDLPKRRLVFDIQVSDKGEIEGLIDKKLVGADWRTIGDIAFDEAAASYNGDFVIHFHHPKWRDDVDDPGSVTGPGRAARAINGLADLIGGVFSLVSRKN